MEEPTHEQALAAAHVAVARARLDDAKQSLVAYGRELLGDADQDPEHGMPPRYPERAIDLADSYDLAKRNYGNALTARRRI